jgi:hypothetical protein
MGGRMNSRDFLQQPIGAFGVAGFLVDALPEGPVDPAHDGPSPPPPRLPPPPPPPLPSGPILSRHGLRGAADINPSCSSNQVFDDHIPGDYWTGYGSQDSETRTYNANWVNNVLQINGRGVHGLNAAPLASSALKYAAPRGAQPAPFVDHVTLQKGDVAQVAAPVSSITSSNPSVVQVSLAPDGAYNGAQMTAVAFGSATVTRTPYPGGPALQTVVTVPGFAQPLQPIRHTGLGGCGCKSCAGAAGTMPGSAQRVGNAAVNAARAIAASPLRAPSIVAAVLPPQPVPQTPCDTRWQQPDYPPTEGPTDADIRCADCWWINQVVPESTLQGAQEMNFGGRNVQGFGSAYGLPESPPTPVKDHPPGWPPGISPTPVGPGNPIGPSLPGYFRGSYGRVECPAGSYWDPRIGRCVQQLHAGDHPVQGENYGYRTRGLRGAPQGQQGLGATSPTSPATVGLVAALGGTVGLVVGAGLGAELGSGGGIAAARRATVGGLIGVLAGSFAGAMIAAPSVTSQSGS